jgi:hypothetical protein
MLVKLLPDQSLRLEALGVGGRQRSTRRHSSSRDMHQSVIGLTQELL